DLQNFNPTPSGTDFITVHSGRTLSYGEFNFGTFLTYATNSLPYSTLSAAPNNQNFSEPNDRILNSNLHVAVGLMEGWDLGVSAGFTNAQDIETSNFLFNYGDTGINDILIRSKARFYTDNKLSIALVTGIDFDQIKNNPFIGDNAGPSISAEAVIDVLLTPKWRWAINAGYRFRQEGTPIPNTGVTPMPDQWLYSSAMSYLMDDKGSAVIAEIYGSYPTEVFSLPTDRQISNLETLLGYKWQAMEELGIHGGFGTGVYRGLGSPDFRVYLGLNWTMGFHKTRDSIIPIDDGSSTEPLNKEELPQQLPEKQDTLSATDTDMDGIRDDEDQCPGTPPGTKVNQLGCEISTYSEE
ncbi:MAG: hypothetical protein HRT44_11610, partial [Bdellovibrionales bacterium]|nr:hypothetical protein [Bdellovibrionales bacterium]NQZ19888.1 hypothetical protein [Bdellovibrionales bacterium]